MAGCAASTAVVFLLAVSAALPPGRSAAAQDDFRQLDAKQIRSRLVGQDLTDGSHWSMYLRPGGTLIGTESNTRWTGKWKLQQAKLCMSTPGSASLDCYEVWMAGAKVSLRMTDGAEAFAALIERHKSN
jgi:hypothetical protein